jgi:hypothetical protein
VFLIFFGSSASSLVARPGTKKSVVGGSDIGWLRDGLDGGVLLAPVSDIGEPGSDFDQ